MKYSFHSICNRLHENKKYVNAYTILLVDIFLSVMSSFITLLFADSFIIDLSRPTYVVIIGGSCVVSLLVFWGLRVNRNIIRHATIKSIGKMGFAIFLKELLLAGMILVSGSRLFGQHLFACAVIDFLVTSVILVESGKIGDTTRISANAANTPWGSGRLQKGDTYQNIDLLYAMLLPSANDAATAVAEGVSGSAGKFVERMNRKAAKLGWKNTHFCNPHGLNDRNHYTTALELAKLTSYAYGKGEIRKAMKTRTRTIKSVRYQRKWKLYSSDTLLGKIRNFFGGKTGTGSDAKYCFTGVYKYKNKTYVTVVLGANSPAGRWSDTRRLQSYIRKDAETRY